MKTIILYVCLAFFPITSFSQPGWNKTSLGDLWGRLNDVYFLNKDTGFAVNSSGNVYKTLNAGVSWTSINLDGAALRSIEFLNDGVTGIAGSLDNKVYRTYNAGGSWQDITASFANIGSWPKSICGIAHIGDIFYGVGWWGADTAKIFKSTDKGVSWTTTMVDTSLASNLVDAVFLSADTGFATGGKNTTNVGHMSNQAVILKTTDGGVTWARVFIDSVIGGRVWKIQALSSSVLVGSIEPYYKDTVAMVRSVDGGNTWTEIGTGFHAPGGFQPSSGMGTTQGIGFVTEKKGWIGGWYNGWFETLDSGHTWQYINFGKNWNRIFVVDSTRAYAGGDYVYRYEGPKMVNHIASQLARLPHDLYPVYPNPSKGNVKIEFELKTETNVVLEVANTDSRSISRILSKRMKPGHYTYYWDGRNAPNGHYIIWLGTDEIPITQKFVLER